ncbi:MAG: YidC/Oxa1 family insertase periplasmic-domain containing protein [Candidatus Rifleibacteriota bacterium]
MNFSANKNENNFKILSSVICFFAFLGFLLIPAQLAGETESQQQAVGCILEDVDGDGFRDATIETKLFRTVISSKTGAPSVYFLKGSNFEENMYPPVLQDLGYSFAPETMKPFVGRLQNGSYADKGFNIELDEESDDKIVVRANANLGGEASGGKKLAMAAIYTFFNGSYHFEVDYVISNLEEKLVAVGSEQNGAFTLSYGPGLFMDPFGESSILGLTDSEVESFSEADAVSKSDAKFSGIGLKNQYFTVLMDAQADVKAGATQFKVKAANEKKKEQTGHTISLTVPQFNLGAKESRSFSFRIYFGPILLDQLKSIDRGMVSEYGFLSTILLRILQFFYSLIPNYGLAIILLTIVVRLVLYPLTLKQTKSMAHMQKIQPKVQDLKDRYKDTPQKFNEEVLKLYQKHNVNPLGGCLPLLLQLPILIALYNTIRIAVELRKTPFLWISDLSKGDPLLILPIAIAALMYYQQGKMTDPKQRQMMAFMPMFMFVITWSLPAGLLVYWFASSVIGLLQQLQANRIAEAIKEE